MRAHWALATILAQIPPFRVSITRAIYRLSVLVGWPPGALLDLFKTAKLPRDANCCTHRRSQVIVETQA